MYGDRRPNSSDSFGKGALSRHRHKGTFRGACSAAYLDLRDGHGKTHRLKGHQVSFNISALYVLYVF